MNFHEEEKRNYGIIYPMNNKYEIRKVKFLLPPKHPKARHEGPYGFKIVKLKKF